MRPTRKQRRRYKKMLRWMKNFRLCDKRKISPWPALYMPPLGPIVILD